MNPIQRSACALAASLSLVAAASADVVRVDEVPSPAPDAMYEAVNIAADGTVVGWMGIPQNVVRWRPGEPAENLGGDIVSLTSYTPLISRDGAVIAATAAVVAAGSYTEVPSLWAGGTQWQPITGTVLGSAAVVGISANGTRLAGVGGMPGGMPNTPWIWSAQGGQVVLPLPPARVGAEASGVSNDGRIAVGYAYRAQPDFNRYGVVWTDGAATALTDAQQRPVGRAMACNSDCSVIVGAGIEDGTSGSRLAWRRTAQGGIEYLAAVAGAQPAATYFAMDTSEDGATIVGFHTHEFDDGTATYNVNRPFVWTAAGGTVNLVAWLAANGVDYGADFIELVVLSMSPDGRRLLVAGRDANRMPRHAIVRIDPDAIFAHGFEAAD